MSSPRGEARRGCRRRTAHSSAARPCRAGPTTPLRPSGDVRGAWEPFLGSGADFLVSVTPIAPHYFHWALEPEGEWWHMVFGDRYLIERPLLPPVHRPNGAIKIGRSGPLRE